MHYYQFNIGDYASHTKGLSLIEDLAYRRMIDEYYLNEQPLNGCSTGVARCCGLLEHVEEVEYVLSRFFVKEGDLWRHKRIDLEIKTYQTGRSAKSKAGKASAKARKLKASEQVLDSVGTGVEQPLKSVEQTNNHKPVTNNQLKDKPLLPGAVKTPPGETPVLTIPTISFNTRGEVFNITSSMITEWQDTYPLMDVDQELKRAIQWSRDNPGKRKTLTGMKRYLGSWLSRRHDKGYANENARGNFGGGGNKGRLSAGDRVRAKAEQRANEGAREVGPGMGGPG